MEAARSVGAEVSFDLSDRETLWAAAGGEAGARTDLGRIVENVTDSQPGSSTAS